MQIGDAFQEAADAGGMDFDSEIVVLGMFLRDRRGGFAHAETDFEDPGRRAAEEVVQIERYRREGYAVDGQQLGVGAALGFGNAPLAQDETSNLAPVVLQEMFSYARPSAISGQKPASWGWRSRAFSACVRRERLRVRPRPLFSSPAPSAPGSALSRPPCS